MNDFDACEFGGTDKMTFGTSVDLEIFYEDYKYAGYPAFCSWEHAAAWFNQARPDFTSWDKSADRRPAPGDRILGGALITLLLLTIGLAVVGLVSILR